MKKNHFVIKKMARKLARKFPKPAPRAPQSIAELLDADVKNLRAQVEAGKPLRLHHRKLLESRLESGTSGPPAFVANYSALARVLGTSRQRLAYLAKCDDAPQPREDGRHEVAAWKTFLADRGRLTEPGSDSPRGASPRLTFEDGILAAHYRMSAALPAALTWAMSEAKS